TPVTDGEHVYALFASGDLVGLDKGGNLLWYRALARDYPTLGNNVGMAASPVLWNDVLLLAMDNPGDSFVAGIDTKTGQNRWKNERKRQLNWVTPLLVTTAMRAEVLFQSSEGLTAYNPQNGEIYWSYEAAGLGNIPSPVIDGQLLL